MSEQVVIRSTENGPNLIIVDGKVVNAWCGAAGRASCPFVMVLTRRTVSWPEPTRSRLPQRDKTRAVETSPRLQEPRGGRHGVKRCRAENADGMDCSGCRLSSEPNRLVDSVSYHLSHNWAIYSICMCH